MQLSKRELAETQMIVTTPEKVCVLVCVLHNNTCGTKNAAMTDV